MWKVREKKEKRKGQDEFGSIWNPKNLQKEVHAFGYNFSWKTYLLTLLCALLLIAVLGIFFQLHISYIGVIVVVMLVLLPVLIINMYRQMYEQKRFSDVSDYMEQLLYSFRKEKKVLRALREVYDTFADGMMKQSIGEAIEYIEAGRAQTEDGVLPEALQIIEKRYMCEKLHTVHELLVSAEERGGEAEHSIALLIEDIEVWKRQVYGLQKNKKVCHTDCILSIVAAALICGIDMYVMNEVKDMMNASADVSIFDMAAVQMTSFLFILLCFFTFYKSSRKLTEDWLRKNIENEAALLKSYEFVIHYDKDKELVRSVLLAIPFMIASVVCYFLVSPVVSVLCLGIGVFLLLQHEFSYKMNAKDVKNALYQAFPEWMMDMSLLLQTNNVQVAIAKSAPRAEKIMRNELEMLLERVRQNPGDVRSYTAFCETYDIPEITTCMKMLYSISESGAGDVQTQIENLVVHVHKLQEKEAELKNQNISFKMRSICFYPVAATSVKLLVDMTVGALLILQMFQMAF